MIKNLLTALCGVLTLQGCALLSGVNDLHASEVDTSADAADESAEAGGSDAPLADMVTEATHADASSADTSHEAADAGAEAADASAEAADAGAGAADARSEQGDDASSGDAGSCVASGTGVIAVPGCPCPTFAALACYGNAQRVTLVCTGGVWTYSSTCPSGQNCDTTAGPNEGLCANINPACARAKPSDHVCSGSTTIAKCGPDLVSTSPIDSCTNQACVGGACTGVCTPGTLCNSCLSGTQRVSGTCDDTGTCGAGTTTPCAPYACGTTACKTNCTTDSDCMAGDFCWLAACVKITAVSTGDDHTCALTTAGNEQCWGSNSAGQLGNGSTTNSPIPVPVSAGSSPFAAISAGYGHTCALTTAGGAQCWGANSDGQLGNNSTTSSTTPVAVAGLSSSVASISTGTAHTCAVTTSGGVKCWGLNQLGQLGNNSTTNSPVPVSVSGLSSGVASVSASSYYTCALTTSGGVWCWGENDVGQLGNNSTTSSPGPVPVSVSGLSSGVTALYTGPNHSCALLAAGGVKCWGFNNAGQLGNNATTDSSVPVAVSVLPSGVKALALSNVATCALSATGGVLCWGINYDGELGNNSSASSLVPVAVSGLESGVAAISASGFHTCAVTSAGAAVCWGNNDDGELGNNSTTDSHVPVNVVEP